VRRLRGTRRCHTLTGSATLGSISHWWRASPPTTKMVVVVEVLTSCALARAAAADSGSQRG
jgi:hypothetical protein